MHDRCDLSPHQRSLFQDQGHLTMENLCSPEEVQQLGELFDSLCKQRTGKCPQDYRLPPSMGSYRMMYPERLEPSLLTTRYFRDVRDLGAQLLEVPPEEMNLWSAFLLKPAQARETPWHQDAARRPDPYAVRSLNFWMPLEHGSEANGCLSFVEGSHIGQKLRQHFFNGRELATEIKSVDRATAIPLPAGSTSVHHGFTLHKAGANTTTHPRRAFVICTSFQVPKD